MHLTELVVTPSPHAKLPKGVNTKDFEDSCRHVLEVFRSYLPEEYTLDGIPNHELRLGARGDDPRYNQGKAKSISYVEAFDFGAWKKAKAAEQDELILDAMVYILDRIAQAFRGDRNAIKDAAKKTKAGDYANKIPNDDLSLAKGSGVRVSVYRALSRKGEDWGADVVKPGSKGDKVLRTVWLDKNVDPKAVTKKYIKAKWDGSNFLILNSSGKSSFKLTLKPEEEAV